MSLKLRQPKVPFGLILWVFTFMGFAPTAWAQIDAPTVKITLSGANEALPSGRVLRRSWVRACTRLGEGLLLGKGPFGYGAFESFSCFLKDKRVSGTSVTKSSAWELTIAADTGGWSVRLQSPTGPKADLFVEADLALPHSPFNLRYLADPEFADLMAYGLLVQSPLAMTIDLGKLRGKRKNRHLGNYHRFARQTKFDFPRPPTNLQLYTVRFDKKSRLWLPTVVGEARRGRVLSPRSGKKGRRGRVVYRVKAPKSSRTVWAQNKEGPGSLLEDIQEEIESAHSRMQNVLKTGLLEDYLTGRRTYLGVVLAQSASSGFIGGRYGAQVQPGDSLLAGTSLVGALLEIRGGPASGLRYYYDAVPRNKTTENFLGKDIDLYIEWSRHVLGFGFGFDMDFFINWIDAIPKAGVVNFKGNIATERDDDDNLVRFQEFTTENTLALELDLGMERRSESYTVRLWYAYGQGVALEKDQAALTSQKFGIDTFFKVGPEMAMLSQDFQLALLVFYTFETVQLTAPENEEEQRFGIETIDTITYTGGYAGAGLALSW